MVRSHVSWAGVLALAVAGAWAQPPVPSVSTGAPGQALAPLRLEFASALDGYRAFVEPAPLSWREANQVAGSLGGHAGQVRGRGPVAPGAGAAARMPGDPAALPEGMRK